MSDFKMIANSPLDGYAKDFDGVRLTEITDRAIVSIATPRNDDGHLAKTIKTALNAAMPTVGESQRSSFFNGRLLGMQPEQLLFLFDYAGNDAVGVVVTKLKDAAYLSDQSDSSVMLEISGDNARLVLERICQIDLQPDVFSIGRVARTSMEYLSVIILRELDDTFLLISPRSSARSFLHAVETSIYNVI